MPSVTASLVLAEEPPPRPLTPDEWFVLCVLTGSERSAPDGDPERFRRSVKSMVRDGLLRAPADESSSPFPEASAPVAPAANDELFDAVALALNLLRARYGSFVGDRLLHGRLLEAQRRAAARYPSLLFVELDLHAGLMLSAETRQALAASFPEPQRLAAAFRELMEEFHCAVVDLVPAFRDLDLRDVTSLVADKLEPLGFYDTSVFGTVGTVKTGTGSANSLSLS